MQNIIRIVFSTSFIIKIEILLLFLLLLIMEDKKTVLTPNYTIRQNNNPQISLSEKKINLLKKQAIKEHAKYLGMDLLVDKEFLWIANQSLLAPLPPDWEQFESHDGTFYYFHQSSNKSTWIHPLDDHYRKMFQTEKKHKLCKEPNRKTEKRDENEITKLYNIRKNVSKHINTDLNLLDAKIKPTMTECNPNLWENRITRNPEDKLLPHLLTPMPSTGCPLNIFNCF